MFLPDGRVLIMDQEQYKKVIDQSIVLDLAENDSEILPDANEPQEMDREEETKTGLARSKDNNRKQSQANQKRKPFPEDNHTPDPDATVIMRSNDQEDRLTRLLAVTPDAKDYLPILN